MICTEFTYKNMRLPIPYHSQKTDYNCGPASLQMVFGYFKSFHSQSELAKLVRTTPEVGTGHQHMIEAAIKNGFHCYVNEDSTIHEIKHYLNTKLPVIVNYTEPSWDEGHYAVVSGYTPFSLVLNDPWNGKNFKMSFKRFLSRWHDHWEHKTYHHWIMVISKKDFDLGKVYHPA